MANPPLYNPTVPERLGDTFAVTQKDLQDNFQSLFNAFSANHVAMNETNAGNHTFINLLERANPILTNLSEIAIYSKDVEGQTDQMFFRYQGEGIEFQFTNYQLYSIPPENPNDPNKGFKSYFTFLPGRVIVYFGIFAGTGQIGAQTLKLVPEIATNIIGVSVCNAGTAPVSKDVIPQYQLTVDPAINGIFSTLQFSRAFAATITDAFYMVVANT
jgi:hypothetical protein